MPRIYKLDEDPEFFKVGPPSAEWLRAGVEAVGSRIANFIMDDDVENKDAPVASLLWLPPNDVLPRHAHDCHRVEVLVRGSLTVDGQILHPGDVSVSLPNEFYGPHIAGPTGSLSVEIFSKATGLLPEMEQDPDEESRKMLEKFGAGVEAFQRQQAASGAGAS
jgi:hypothetical protein